MTRGQGFALEITENSLIPVLDKITVTVQAPIPKTLKFSFGGQIGEAPENVSNDTIISNGSAATARALAMQGNATPKISPLNWGESGTPRTMTFFVPYAIGNLKDGDYSLDVKLTTIDRVEETYSSKFKKSSKVN